MQTRQVTGSASQLMVEQLAASGIKYVFYNSGSREANFFDALYANPNIDGILGLHEGSVTAMAGGYAQASLDATVMVVHLGAGLAQCLGQLINVWWGGLPVVVITFAGDTGSFGDRISLDLGNSFGPTSISAPFTKASWTVVEPEGLPQVVERAVRVAKTPPVGPVHIAVYDRLLSNEPVTSNIIESGMPDLRAGFPADGDIEELASALHEAERPLIYVGDGAWKSGAEAGVVWMAEHFGAAIAGDLRGAPIKHKLHCGRIDTCVSAVNPDLIVSVGVRHNGAGLADDYAPFSSAKSLVAIGPDGENIRNIPGLDLAILADEQRTLDRLRQLVLSESTPTRYDERRSWAEGVASQLRSQRRQAASSAGPQEGRVRPSVLADALDNALEDAGGGLVTIEQFAVPLDITGGGEDPGKNVYIRAAGGSEGFGIGAAVGAKLGAPDLPVVGLVGDGSLFYADSGLWTTVHHKIPVLYVIPNNQAYGIVAGFFGGVDGHMRQANEYEGVALDGIDPVKIAEGYGVEGIRVDDESTVQEAIARGLDTVDRERRPLLLDVRLPQGLPDGGRPSQPYQL